MQTVLSAFDFIFSYLFISFSDQYLVCSGQGITRMSFISRYFLFRDKTVCVSDHYFNGCMQKRNRFLADISSLCICYLTKNTGGTAYTVRYAQKEGLKIVNITDLIPLDKRL